MGYFASKLTSSAAWIGAIILVLLFLHLHTFIFIASVLLIVIPEDKINAEFRIWARIVSKKFGLGGWK